MTLFALCLPVILILTGLAIDGGRLFIAKAHMQSIIDAAATAGASAISDEIVNIIEIKKAANPELEIPEDITELLNDSDRLNLLNLDEVHQTIHTYIELNNTTPLNEDSLEIHYPYNFTFGDPVIGIQLTWQLPVDLLFAEILDLNEITLKTQTLSTVRITP